MTIHTERHLAAEIVVSAIIAAIVIALIAIIGPTKDAQAEAHKKKKTLLCPFGCENLKPQTPASCFESFSKPECENTKIDPGNDREEWQYLSEGYPQQVIALGNYEQSAWEEVEFQMARKRYWRFRALRCERGE